MVWMEQKPAVRSGEAESQGKSKNSCPCFESRQALVFCTTNGAFC